MFLLKCASLAALWLGLLAPAAATAQTWHGQICCAVITGLNTKPLVGEFVMNETGTRLSYSRPVHDADTSTRSGVDETGTGTVTGNEITLQGGASGAGYRYMSNYQGSMAGNRVTLTGEQVWTANRLPQPFHRACHIALTR